MTPASPLATIANLVELLRWAAGLDDPAACREACALAVRRLQQLADQLSGEPGSAGDEAPQAVGEAGEPTERASPPGRAVGPGALVRPGPLDPEEREERIWRLRRDLNLGSPLAARLLARLLARPGQAVEADFELGGRTPTKVIITRLRRDLSAHGLGDAITTVRRNRYRGWPGGYAYSRFRVNDLQALVTFDLGDLSATP